MKRHFIYILALFLVACVPGSGTDGVISGIGAGPDTGGATSEGSPEPAGEFTDTPPLAGPGEDRTNTVEPPIGIPEECVGQYVGELNIERPVLQCRLGNVVLSESQTQVTVHLPNDSASIVNLIVQTVNSDGMQSPADSELVVTSIEPDPETGRRELSVKEDGTLTFQVAATDKIGRYVLVLLNEDDCRLSDGIIEVISPCYIPFTRGAQPVDEETDDGIIQADPDSLQPVDKEGLLYQVKPPGMKVIEGVMRE